MTTTSLLEKIENASKLWALLLPHVTPPDARTFGIWVTQFDPPLVDLVFARVAAKFRNYHGGTENVYRYTSATLRNAADRAALATPQAGVQSEERGTRAL